MKKLLIATSLVIVICALILSGGCRRIDLSGNATTKDFNDITGFTRINVGSTFNANITRADSFSVSVVINEKLVDRLKVVKNGDTLEVGFKSPTWGFWGFEGRPEVTITLPDLRGLELSGASEGTVNGFKSSNDLKIQVSGASTLTFDAQSGNFNADISGASGVTGTLKASASHIVLSGASHATLSGSGGDATIDASGASHIDLSAYPVGNADVTLSGASSGSIYASGKLNVDLS
ncbi:MAG TPA: DUF2807 domain-containing protein, partial [Dehalococcoidales bacterium]|nr:DUF2807 domain-containing protein [Dehalococcoidales bacterium]